jgi:hypothetical protein
MKKKEPAKQFMTIREVFFLLLAIVLLFVYSEERGKVTLYKQMIALEQGYQEEKQRDMERFYKENLTIHKEYEDKLGKLLDALIKAEVKVTAYTPSEDETDSTPFINAMNKPIRYNTVAVSRDLEVMGFVFKEKILATGVGVLSIEDRMNPRYKMSIDICVRTKEEARKIGKTFRTIMLLNMEAI